MEFFTGSDRCDGVAAATVMTVLVLRAATVRRGVRWQQPLDWQNPHAYFYLDVKDDSGATHSWSFQTYALITLKRAGTDRQVFIDNIGKEVFVRGCLAKNGREHYAAAGTMRFADGELRQVGQLQN
jgi:hypothetical protein